MTLADARAFDEAEIAAGLAALPHWTCTGAALERRYSTVGFKAALMVTATIGQLCEAAWHHPELIVSYAGVVVKLWTHTTAGVTAKDFELAAEIERTVTWQSRGPRDGGTLTGPPDKHAILRHD